MNEPINETPTARVAPLSATAVKMPPYAQAAGAVIDAAMQIATLRAFPVEPNGDDFRLQEQLLLRLASVTDSLANLLIECAEANSPCHFPLCPQPMMSALKDSDVLSAFKEAAKECDDANSPAGRALSEADRRWSDR